MSRPLVALRCDAGRDTGLGHLLRCIALAEALQGGGCDVVLLGSVGDVPLAERLLAQRQIPVHPAPEGPLPPLLDALGAVALVVDSYDVPPTVNAEVRASGRLVVAIVDAAAPDLDADLLVNPNYGAEAAMASPHQGAVLAGVPYALLRSSVTHRRPPAPPGVPVVARRVLVVLGGTDVLMVAATATEQLLATGLPLEIDVVCSTPEILARVDGLPRGEGQRVSALLPVEDLAGLAAGADLVLSAAGTTVWELACLGRPMALVTVADNQLPGYEAVVSAGLAMGLGPAAGLGATPEATALLLELMKDAPRRRRLAGAGHALVDGLGRDRVAAAVRTMLREGSVGRVVEQETS